MQRSFLGFHRQVLPPVTNYLLGWLLPTKKNSTLKYHTMKTQPDQMQLNSFFTFSIQMLTPLSISKPRCTITFTDSNFATKVNISRRFSPYEMDTANLFDEAGNPCQMRQPLQQILQQKKKNTKQLNPTQVLKEPCAPMLSRRRTQGRIRPLSTFQLHPFPCTSQCSPNPSSSRKSNYNFD